MNKQTVLITGANRGIGFELCKILASQNNFTIVLSSRNEQEGLKKVQELATSDSNISFFYLDVSDHNHIKGSILDFQRKFGNIDILVNNAGIYIDSEDLDQFPSFFDVTPQILRQSFDTNLFGPLLLTQLFLPFFNDNGLIINISSGMGKINTTDDRSGHIAYRMSKTSLNTFSKSLSKMRLPKRIKVISMCPGWVSSEMGGPNAPRTVIDGATDIFELISKKNLLKSGAFYYNFVEQKA